ncbi:hypothetical protein [Haloarchaeobius sp. DFWS5]|uniref:hypothetical protein n=1 Tax=Haloarchaeobius sp. DFWS5 TaxID=3446114 RepID=UPI003EBBC327
MSWDEEISRLSLPTVDRTLALFPGGVHTRDRAVVDLELVAGDDGPPHLQATLWNQHDHPRTVLLDDLPFHKSSEVVDVHVGGSYHRDRPELFLVPTPNHHFGPCDVETEQSPRGVWRLTERPDYESVRSLTLAPDESVLFEYALLLGPDGDEIPVGQYPLRGWPAHRFVPGLRTWATLSVWQTSRPGPDEPSRFADESFPSVPPHFDETTWFHDATATTEVYLRPSTERASLPAAVEFTLVNRGERRLRGPDLNWGLYELVDGDWAARHTHGAVDIETFVEVGEEKTWRLRARRDEVLHCDPDDYAEPSVGNLSPGRYAFWVEYGTGDGHDGFGAVVEFE